MQTFHDRYGLAAMCISILVFIFIFILFWWLVPSFYARTAPFCVRCTLTGRAIRRKPESPTRPGVPSLYSPLWRWAWSPSPLSADERPGSLPQAGFASPAAGADPFARGTNRSAGRLAGLAWKRSAVGRPHQQAKKPAKAIHSSTFPSRRLKT